ncbi:hypothetical protein TBLA_0A05540 [Henningerozyma blattae CBS 6284]|uniref:Uncharacterized protein n=1 Tax=Henningerozyma blattae (strain ATCC 34711 / CBS 6284 / DSM 70876 / NBRC 10599 / NRRL Y-10934 / UCD 77-7) TaxID=1071380 RepID=I2GW45_HENB6|nr:hypothetical protein TBLA_0A05540 [Tetrapisispora blattae CBS 6284]CCH58347.1 hypothetical protein TBLA_0A05540 [Tetrapisispora blattae CBS 6284]
MYNKFHYGIYFCLIPIVRNRLGTEPGMLPLISVIVHPGRRVSGTMHGTLYCITGLIFGLAWSIFGRFLGQQCLGSYWKTMTEAEIYKQHFIRYQSALGIMAMFEVIMLFIHGWMRSVNHLYFGIVFPFFLVVHFVFMAPLTQSNATIANSFATPFYFGIALSIFFNLTIFPEFGSTYLGNSIVDTLNHFHKLIDHSTNFFVSVENEDLRGTLYNKLPNSLGKLNTMRSAISKKVSNCGLVFHESLYEISYSYVSPEKLENVIENIRPLSVYVNGLVDACQLKFTLLNKNKISDDLNNNDTYNNNNKDKTESDFSMDMKINQEIEYADVKKLLTILDKVRPSIVEIHTILSECIYDAKLTLAYVYDVNLKKVRSCSMFKNGNFKTFRNKTQVRDEIDLNESIRRLEDALLEYGTVFREDLTELGLDFLKPEDEMFLFSSFLINFKQTIESVLIILRTINELSSIRKRQEAKGWIRGKKIWIHFMRNFTTFKMWLFKSYSSGNTVTESEALRGVVGESFTANSTFVNRMPFEEIQAVKNMKGEDLQPSKSQDTSKENEADITTFDLTNKKSHRFYKDKEYISELTIFSKMTISVRDFCMRSKFHFRFGFQVVIALMVCSFPIFTPKYRSWYRNYRGTWMGFVCILSMEPSIGDTLWVFFLRGAGVLIGSAWAYLSYVAGVNQTNPYLETIITCFGSAPGFYFFLGTPYVKAAIIQIISIYVVMLAAILPSNVPGGILLNFAKRCLAIGYGGGIGLAVQYLFFPLKARDMLNTEISYVCGCVAEMELIHATALEGQNLSESLTDIGLDNYLKVSQSAKAALGRASTYKKLARQEPRIKGEYTSIENVFTQIIFILGQIIDRMDNIALLRANIGSAIIEELNDLVHPYRREVVASISCILRCLQEAFINKTPLPQYLPSARIKHRRLVNSVRQILSHRYRKEINAINNTANKRRMSSKSIYNEETYLSDGNEDEDIIITTSSKKLRQGKQFETAHEFYLKERFLSWNATSSALEEIIAYIEELVKLTRILVGVNAFKYGFLSRPLYEEWAAEAVQDFDTFLYNQQNNSNNNTTDDSVSHEPTPVFGQTPEGIVSDTLASSDEENSFETLDSLPEQPQQYVGDDSDLELGNGNQFLHNLERIPTIKLQEAQQNVQSSYRKRAFSIGTFNDDTSMPLATLLRRKTTEYMDDVTDDDYEDDANMISDIPLALKRIISNKSKHRG